MDERFDLKRGQLVAAFNEWMRRYIEEPDRFVSEWASIKAFQGDEEKGQEPSYGEQCTAMLLQLAGVTK